MILRRSRHRLAKARERGHLLIGHSERVTGPAETSLENVGITAYRLTGAGETKPNQPDTERAVA